MSTKQLVLYILMVFFLVVALVTMGYWFKSSMDLNEKNSILWSLKEKRVGLEAQLQSKTDPKVGLIPRVDDPGEGLQAIKDALDKRVPLLKSNDDATAKGMEQREKEYQDLAPEVKKAWTEDAVKALNEYKADRKKQEEDIKGALERLDKQVKEKKEKEAAAADELAKEEEIREAEIKRIASEVTKMTQELEAVRYEHEETQQKVTEISRDLSKVKDVVSQGKIVIADGKTRTALIDIGTRAGVRKGMTFDIYSGMYRQLVKKGMLEVTEAGPFSSKCVLLDSVRENRWDKVTGWVPESPAYLYSKYAAGGPDETDAIELEKRKTAKDRVEALRLEKLAKEQGLETAENSGEQGLVSEAPPIGTNLTLNPVAEGDWIFNPDFVPIVSPAEFHQQTRDELVSMRDVNVGTLNFYIADTVRPYRKEYLRRLAERNGCKVSDTMNANVNFVVVGTGFTRADLLEDKLASTKGKEDVKPEVKDQRTTLQALVDAKKVAADVLAEDEMEAFFDRRQRKQELLRGKVAQPGISTYFIAGKTKYRSPELLAQYIKDNGGLVAKNIEDKVDYVVVGESPDDAFVEKIKKLGLKIVREEELPELLGIK